MADVVISVILTFMEFQKLFDQKIIYPFLLFAIKS